MLRRRVAEPPSRNLYPWSMRSFADNPIDPTTSLCPLERTITLGFIRSAGQHVHEARRSQAIVALRVMGFKEGSVQLGNGPNSAKTGGYRPGRNIWAPDGQPSRQAKVMQLRRLGLSGGEAREQLRGLAVVEGQSHAASPSRPQRR